MNAFQLDQCSNHKKLAEKCTSEGRCELRRLPPDLINEDDPVVLDRLFALGAPIVTMDFSIVDDNPNSITESNSGIVVVKSRPNTARKMEEMLAAFKSKFPAWYLVDWSKLYLEIEETEVYITPLLNADITGGKTVPLDSGSFANDLQTAIKWARDAKLVDR